MIVTIGGSVAAGKSTLAKGLSGKLGFQRLSAGEIMRQMASEKGMSLMDFSRYAESHPEVDREIDERQRSLALGGGNFVVDGRLSAYFLKPDLKVWLMAPLEVRAKRVIGRGDEYGSLEEASKAISEREGSERRRYREFYGIDLSDLSFYDLVINTGRFDIVHMTDMTYNAVKMISGV